MTRHNRHAVFQAEFLDDLRYWVRRDRKLALRCLDLVAAVLRDPFGGIGSAWWKDVREYVAPR